ncbi:MAG TPA: universal stress protein [Ideonella sp.]|uniref:universal stress protein n=1 Tax=Ideonella sp. TaxID=1929293 RepID=UPI002E359C3B|nr:universal stress protein [Ideonella sp.]HEX5685007.1 universal stress protein [Ideonella sp.]
MKILLAVDGSLTTQRMLAYIAAHDELLGPDHAYTALTVVAPTSAHASTLLPQDTIDSWYESDGEAILAPVRKFAAQNHWSLETRMDVGHPGDVIAKVAQEGRFDLVVMGTHGHSALVNAVLGSVATRVLARLRLPVLLVP